MAPPLILFARTAMIASASGVVAAVAVHLVYKSFVEPNLPSLNEAVVYKSFVEPTLPLLNEAIRHSCNGQEKRKEEASKPHKEEENVDHSPDDSSSTSRGADANQGLRRRHQSGTSSDSTDLNELTDTNASTSLIDSPELNNPEDKNDCERPAKDSPNSTDSQDSTSSTNSTDSTDATESANLVETSTSEPTRGSKSVAKLSTSNLHQFNTMNSVGHVGIGSTLNFNQIFTLVDSDLSTTNSENSTSDTQTEPLFDDMDWCKVN